MDTPQTDIDIDLKLKTEKNKYFMIFDSCKIVKGSKRSIICDLQRNNILFIPNELADFLFDNRIIDLSKKMSSEFQSNIDYLIEKNIGFLTTTPDLFKPIQIGKSDFPRNNISTLIFEITDKITFDLEKLKNEISSLNIETIEIRFFVKFKPTSIINLIKKLDYKNLKTMHLILPYSDYWDLDKIENLVRKFSVLKNIIIYNSTKNDEIFGVFDSKIIYEKQVINNSNKCGIIDPKNFRTNIYFFNEKDFNTCLINKISIESNGKIKNCPSMTKDFGSFNYISLDEISHSNEFKELQFISKDQIDVCKDCEFRYICFDCRAFLTNNYHKPKNCKYDPYKGAWID
jgi:SPASM domain peptide maturase of grasp-with-spasm system